MIAYHATPAMRCRCPARAFPTAQEALEYAPKAAQAFGVGYAVWRAHKGTRRLLKRFPAAKARLRA
jgi:hypothetical protein